MKYTSFIALIVASVAMSAHAKVPVINPHQPSIVGGSVEAGYYAAGWLHVWYSDYPAAPALCSATLIGQHTVLTAGHCLIPNSEYGDVIAVYFGTDMQAPDATALANQDYSAITNYHKALDWEYYPGFDDTTHDNDIGLVTFDENDGTGEFPEIFPVATAALTSANIGLSGLAIGYGRSIPQYYYSGGTRRSTPITISSVKNYTFTWDFNKQTGEGSGCHGDSGGPVLYLGANSIVVMGEIVGPGDARVAVNCRSASLAVNVGAYASWINQVATAWNDHITFVPIP